MIAAKSRDKKSYLFFFKKKNQAFMHLLKSKDLKASRIWHQTPFKNGVARELCLFSDILPALERRKPRQRVGNNLLKSGN